MCNNTSNFKYSLIGEKFMKNYLSKLNTEQYKAATSIDGMNFILAGAGSGKTAVLVARVAYMLDNGIDPKNILLLTFTNKAAKEMKDRIASLVGENARFITACTFHSFCANFLRKNAKLFGFKENYTILDNPDMMDAIEHDRQPYVDARAGRDALEMVLAIYKSAAEGKAVNLPLSDVASVDFAGRFD